MSEANFYALLAFISMVGSGSCIKESERRFWMIASIFLIVRYFVEVL